MFNDRDYVTWDDPTDPLAVNHGWILKQPVVQGFDFAVFLTEDGSQPPKTGAVVENLSVPFQLGTCGDTWANNVRFMIDRDIEGYTRSGGAASRFDNLVIAATNCDFGTNLFFKYDVTTGVLIVQDTWLPGAHKMNQPHGEILLRAVSESTSWHLLGFDPAVAQYGLYDRIGGGHLDTVMGVAEPPAWGVDPGSPVLYAGQPIATNNWVTSNPNAMLQTRIDNEISLPDDGWLEAPLNETVVPTQLSIWKTIDLINGRGTVYGIGATYPFTVLAGYNSLVFEVDGGAPFTVVFTVGTTYSLDNVVKLLNDDVNFGPVAIAYALDNQLLIYTQSEGAASELKIKDYGVAGSTILGWLGLPWEGTSSRGYNPSRLSYGGTIRAIAVPSNWPADGGQVRIASLRVQTNIDDSAVEINSHSNGSNANNVLGFNLDGVGPIFGKISDVTYPLTGNGGLIDLINSYFGGLAIADAAGSSIRFTSLDVGLDAIIEILPETTFDVQSQLGLAPQSKNGAEFNTIQQLVVSPWLQFQVV